MNETDTTTDFLLGVAKEAIEIRSRRDNNAPGAYNAERDPEGYICSLLNALRHWCHRHGMDWDTELCRANECFMEDMAKTTGKTLTDTRPEIGELQCPKCGHKNSFLVEVTEYLLMFSDYIELSDHQGELWDINSSCICTECSQLGVISQFQPNNQKESKHG